MIELNTVEDLIAVITEWHNNVLETIEFHRNNGSTLTIHEAYDNVLDLLEQLPINNNFSLNKEVMDMVTLLKHEEADKDYSSTKISLLS